jgi:hypothetical protein
MQMTFDVCDLALRAGEGYVAYILPDYVAIGDDRRSATWQHDVSLT